jgi:hypothetical protein
MDLLGVIAAESDPPGLDLVRWRALMAEHPQLELRADQADSAHIMIAGAELGRVGWSTSGANELDVYGELEQVGELAAELAVALDGRFVTLQELITC